MPVSAYPAPVAETAPAAPPQVVIIYNGNAGSSQRGANPLANLLTPAPDAQGDTDEPDWVSDARAYIRAETGAAPEIIATQSEDDAHDAVKSAVARKVPLLIAAGGDGTLRLAANHLANTETTLGILPRGTVNVLARELAIPLDDPLAALQIALHGKTRRIDSGCVFTQDKPDGTLFLMMASLGVDATAVDNVDQGVKGFIGAGAYVMSGLSTLAGYDPPAITLTVRGGDLASGVPVSRTSNAFLIIITNTTLYGGDFCATPDAKLDDGLLDVVVFDAAPGLPAPLQRANFVKQFGLAAIGQHMSDADIHYVTAANIEVHCDPPTALQVDGDPFGVQANFRIEVMPNALSVRC